MRKLSFWQKWLLHSLLLWLIVNISAILFYGYKIVLDNNRINTEGKSIRAVSLWDKLISYNFYQATPLLILLIVLLVEVNHHFLFKRKTWIFITGSILTGFIAASLLSLYKWLVNGFRLPLLNESLLIIASYAFVYPLLLEFINKRVFKSERLYEQSRAELNALKAQINPHFLFNTLNSLYGMALLENASNTASGIEQLAGLMRYVLNETAADFVPVTYEINFLEEYLQLQRMRLPELNNKQVINSITYDNQPAVIAPLLLLPFVENAFKYGLSIDNKCYINFTLSIKDRQLEMHLKNSIVHNNKGAGTGIENAKKRLTFLYPNKHKLEISQSVHEYSVLLHLQL